MMEGKLEKEPESMATVQMKADYAASEIYSTAGSEGPPAYKMRQANSVKIAKIVALTVILSSFILGSFILASTYLQAKASCDQMHALDAMLDKELMLEALQQDTPRADSLVQGRDAAASAADDLQDLDKDTDAKKSTSDDAQDTASESDSSDSSYSDSDESTDMNKIHIRLPLDLDLGDIANAVLQNNQKSRMNCVVERRRAEEFVDAPAKTVQLPFGLNLTTDPKKQKVTGERMAIICESGAEEGPANDEAEIFRQILMPMQPNYPIPYGAQPIHPMGGPITHMPNQMPPMMHPLLQHLQPRPMMPQNNMPPHPATMMQPPRPEAPEMRFMRPQQPQPQQPQEPHGEIRIQLQRIPIIPPQFRAMQEDRSQTGPQIQVQQFRGIPQMFRDEQPRQQQQQEMQKPNQAGPQIQVQQLPLSLALQRAGITVNDLQNIQRMAEERFHHEIQQLVADDGSGDADDSSEEDTNAPAQARQVPSELANDQQPPRPDQILPMGRAGYARSMAMNPVRIPVPMMQQVNEPSQPDDSERPHFVQPRSVRSVDSVLKGESNKRVKRCACDCNC